MLSRCEWRWLGSKCWPTSVRKQFHQAGAPECILMAQILQERRDWQMFQLLRLQCMQSGAVDAALRGERLGGQSPGCLPERLCPLPITSDPQRGSRLGRQHQVDRGGDGQRLVPNESEWRAAARSRLTQVCTEEKVVPARSSYLYQSCRCLDK